MHESQLCDTEGRGHAWKSNVPHYRTNDFWHRLQKLKTILSKSLKLIFGFIFFSWILLLIFF